MINSHRECLCILVWGGLKPVSHTLNLNDIGLTVKYKGVNYET